MSLGVGGWCLLEAERVDALVGSVPAFGSSHRYQGDPRCGLKQGDRGEGGSSAELSLHARCFRTVIPFNFYNNLLTFTDDETKAQRS